MPYSIRSRTGLLCFSMLLASALVFGACGDNVTPLDCEDSETICDDGIDNDCDGATDTADSDCEVDCRDEDADGHEDAACGGDDCDDGDAAVHPGAAEDCGNAIDDDCDGDTDSDDAECPVGCDDLDTDGFQDEACGGTDCDDANAAVNPGATEDCGNAIDDDCDGDTDTDDADCPGCPDRDADGHADAACGGDDCNDDPLSGAGFYPGAPEVCDGMDNDCDGDVDEACASQPPVADAGPDRFPAERDDPVSWVVLDGNGSHDPDGELPLTYSWSCDAGTIQDPAAALTRLNDIPCSHPLATPITCSLTVTDAGGNTDDDSMQIWLPNNAPDALVDGAPTGAYTLVQGAADTDPGTTLTIDGSLSSDADGCDAGALTFAWTGPDAGLLSATDVAAPSLPNLAGSYDLSLMVTDPHGAYDTVDVLVVISDCVWVGDACPPAVAGCRLVDTSSGGMTDRVTEALDVAENEGYELVCLSQGDYIEAELIMRAGVGLRGGYQADWTWDGNQTRVDVTVIDDAGAYFGPGAAGASMSRLTLRSDPSVAVSGPRAAVTVDDNPAVVTGCNLYGDNASGDPDSSSTGVRILAGSSGQPILIAGNPDINGAHSTTPGTAYGVYAGYEAELHLLGSTGGLQGPRQSVVGGPALGESFGVYVDGNLGARLRARDNYLIHACSWGESAGGLSAGVFLDGGYDHEVLGTQDIQSCSADESFAVLTIATQDSIIGDTDLILGRGELVSAGIADGYVQLDGSLVTGGSTGLQIVNNRSVWGSDIHEWDDTNRVLSSGIHLVGTMASEASDNGRRIDTGYGQIVIGGRVTNATNPGGLQPVAPGLWTVQTSMVVAERNYFQSGLFSDTPGDELPAVAVQDGLPGDPGGASVGLAFSANAMVADVPALDAMPVQLSRAMAVRLLNTSRASLQNNLIATMSGNHLFGVVLDGASAFLTNNTIDLDLKLYEDFPCPVYLARFGIYGVNAQATNTWTNNAVLVRQLDDPNCGLIPNTDQAAMWFVVIGGAGQVPATTARNNVMFLEGDDLGSADTPDYVVVASDHYDGAPSVLGAWPANAIDALAGVADIGDNAVADPQLIDGSTGGWQRVKNELHLGPSSPCVDAGLPAAAPAEDFFGTSRPLGAAADVGHEEAR